MLKDTSDSIKHMSSRPINMISPPKPSTTTKNTTQKQEDINKGNKERTKKATQVTDFFARAPKAQGDLQVQQQTTEKPALTHSQITDKQKPTDEDTESETSTIDKNDNSIQSFADDSTIQDSKSSKTAKKRDRRNQ